MDLGRWPQAGMNCAFGAVQSQIPSDSLSDSKCAGCTVADQQFSLCGADLWSASCGAYGSAGSRKLRAQADTRFSPSLLKMRIAGILRVLLDISRILNIDSATLGWVEWQPCRQAFLPHAISGMISDFVVFFSKSRLDCRIVAI